MHAHIRLCTDTHIHPSELSSGLSLGSVCVCLCVSGMTDCAGASVRSSERLKKKKKIQPSFPDGLGQAVRLGTSSSASLCHGQLCMWAGLSSRQSHGSPADSYAVISDPTKFFFFSPITPFCLLQQQITRQGDSFRRSCDPVIPFLGDVHAWVWLSVSFLRLKASQHGEMSKRVSEKLN